MSIIKISQFINPTTGFFKHMAFDFTPMTKEQLDIMFFANYGDKNPAPIVTKMLSLDSSVIDTSQLAIMVESLYSVKWNKLKKLGSLEYDPIHNYKDILTESIGDVGKDTIKYDGSTTITRVATENRDNTRTDNLSAVVDKDNTLTVNSNTDDGLYGFNSTDSVNSDTSKTVETTTDKGTNIVTNTGTQKNVAVNTDNITDTKITKDSKVSDIVNDRTRNSTHEGNIGNLTTQQLMKQEIELWQWNFIQMVLADVKDFLTIPIYLR